MAVCQGLGVRPENGPRAASGAFEHPPPFPWVTDSETMGPAVRLARPALTLPPSPS